MNINKKIKYVFAGGIATFSNLFIIFICVNYLKLWYLISAVISFCIAVIISYALQKFFVFRNFSTDKIYKQFSSFFVFALIMLGVNTLLMYFFVDVIGVWYILAQALTSILTAVINFICFNNIIFIND